MEMQLLEANLWGFKIFRDSPKNLDGSIVAIVPHACADVGALRNAMKSLPRPTWCFTWPGGRWPTFPIQESRECQEYVWGIRTQQWFCVSRLLCWRVNPFSPKKCYKISSDFLNTIFRLQKQQHVNVNKGNSTGSGEKLQTIRRALHGILLKTPKHSQGRILRMCGRGLGTRPRTTSDLSQNNSDFAWIHMGLSIRVSLPYQHSYFMWYPMVPWYPLATPCLLNSTTLNWAMCRFLCPWEKMDAESRAALPGALRESLEKEGATLTGHPPWQRSQKGWATSWCTCTTVYRIPYCTVWQFEAGTWSDLGVYHSIPYFQTKPFNMADLKSGQATAINLQFLGASRVQGVYLTCCHFS